MLNSEIASVSSKASISGFESRRAFNMEIMNKEKLKEYVDILTKIHEGRPWQYYSFLYEWYDATKDDNPLDHYGHNIRLKDPYAELKAAREAGKTIQITICGKWNDISKGDTIHWMYPPEEYRIKPEDPYAELKAAHAAGNIIQTIDRGEYVDWPIKGPESWCFPVNEYRIKPDPYPELKATKAAGKIKDPYAELKAAKAAGKIIEVFIFENEWGSDRWSKKENDSWCLPVSRYRTKPDPANLSREDVPPGSVIKPIGWDNDSYVNYEAVVTNGIRMIGQDWGEFCHSNGYIPWDDLASDWQINRSLCRGKWDSTDWEPCTKEVC